MWIKQLNTNQEFGEVFISEPGCYVFADKRCGVSIECEQILQRFQDTTDSSQTTGFYFRDISKRKYETDNSGERRVCNCTEGQTIVLLDENLLVGEIQNMPGTTTLFTHP